eukprot:TRINITY_DN2717_c0_g1_i1.p2 TRINITY_DN2717_c0_g1~~TRINITY_DN2717_c0_g1_i1.p2  ORF type:complete len:574 (-),score=58.35 TRINITY_DN2717_c0_g1_i1:2068-3684(-)
MLTTSALINHDDSFQWDRRMDVLRGLQENDSVSISSTTMSLIGARVLNKRDSVGWPIEVQYSSFRSENNVTSFVKQASLKGQNIIRRLVAKGRRRFVQHGFDLDLAYVTKRIISTSFPASGKTALFRNSMKEFCSFLNTFHPNKFRVLNLCSESRYDPGLLDNRVARYPCDDMQPPSLEVLDVIVCDAQRWLEADPQHIIAVHCKAGKGRTGIAVCALLLQMQICKTVEEALDLFAHRRTKNGRGVTIASQQRYIHYYDRILRGGSEVQRQASWGGASVLSVRLVNIVKLLSRTSNITLKVFNRNIWTSLSTVSIATVQLPSARELQDGSGQVCRSGYCFSRDGDDIVVEFNCCFNGKEEMQLYGDVKLQVFRGVPSTGNSLFYLWFNVGLEAENPVLDFKTKSLDKISYTAKHLKLGAQIQLQPPSPTNSISQISRSEVSVEDVVKKLQRDSDDNLCRSSAGSRRSSPPSVPRSSSSRNFRNYAHDSAISLRSVKSCNNFDATKKEQQQLRMFSSARQPTCGIEIIDKLEKKWFHGI